MARRRWPHGPFDGAPGAAGEAAALLAAGPPRPPRDLASDRPAPYSSLALPAAGTTERAW